MQAPDKLIESATTLMRWTTDDYHRLVDSGVLRDRRIELIDGDLIEMAPEGPIHSYTTASGADYLRQCFANQALVREAHPITLSASEPEPDIAVVHLPRERYKARHPYPEEVLLLVEIAKSTLSYDLNEKKRVYAAANIPEYWVVDVAVPQVHIFRKPQDGDYIEQRVMTTGCIQPVAISAMSPALSIDVEKLWQ